MGVIQVELLPDHHSLLILAIQFRRTSYDLTTERVVQNTLIACEFGVEFKHHTNT